MLLSTLLKYQHLSSSMCLKNATDSAARQEKSEAQDGCRLTGSKSKSFVIIGETKF
jgi:hypothetical protein